MNKARASRIEQVRRWTRDLKKHFPLVCRCIVRIKPRGTVLIDGKRVLAAHWWTVKSFIIELEYCPNYEVMIDRLIHEWGHGRAYPDQSERAAYIHAWIIAEKLIYNVT